MKAAALAAKQAQLSAPGFPKGKVAGGKVGVRFDLKGDNALVRMTGPGHLVNNPTKAHPIQPKRRQALLIPTADRPRASAQHPGTSGRKFWQKGRKLSERVAPEVYVREQVNGVLRALGG